MSQPARKRTAHPNVYPMPTRSHDFSTLRRQARHDDDLSHQARHLFEDICELAEKSGHCNAGDKHFAAAFGVERRTVRRWVAELKKAGYVRVEGATRNRTLTPTEPSNLGHDLGQQDVLKDADLGHDLGHFGDADLGHPGADTKSIYIPEREERDARASGRDEPFTDRPEESLDETYSAPQTPTPLDASRPAHAPAWESVRTQARMSGITEDMARRFFLHYEAQGWLTGSGQPITSVRAKLAKWKLDEPAFTKRGATGQDSASPEQARRALIERQGEFK